MSWLLFGSSQHATRPEHSIALCQIFDEILVNAADNKQRDASMNLLKIDIDVEANRYGSLFLLLPFFFLEQCIRIHLMLPSGYKNVVLFPPPVCYQTSTLLCTAQAPRSFSSFFFVFWENTFLAVTVQLPYLYIHYVADTDM